MSELIQNPAQRDRARAAQAERKFISQMREAEIVANAQFRQELEAARAEIVLEMIQAGYTLDEIISQQNQPNQ
jgi:hypothetical protein